MDKFTKYAGLIEALLLQSGWVDASNDLLAEIEECEGVSRAVTEAKLVRDLMIDLSSARADGVPVPLSTSEIESYINEHSQA